MGTYNGTEIMIRPQAGKNRTPEVVRTLLQAQDGTVLKFEEGVYDFYEEGAYEGYFVPACNRSSDKKVIFPLLNRNAITIDGSGARFLFHSKVTPFIVQNCKKVTFQNFSVDFSFERCCIGKVGRVDEKGIEILVDREKYPYFVQNHSLCFEAGNHIFSNAERRFTIRQFTDKSFHCFLASGEIYYKDNETKLPSNVFFCDVQETPDGFVLAYHSDACYRPDLKTGEDLKICYDTYRDNDVFFLERSQDLFFSNVRIYKGEGMGIVGQNCENLELNRFMIQPEKDFPEAYSTTADGVLLSNFTGKVQMDHCVISGTMDDAMSVHGFYARAEKIIGPAKILARILHPSQGGCNVFFPGDRIRIADGIDMNVTGTAEVKESHIEDDPYLIHLEFTEAITGRIKPGDILENPERTPQVEVRNCLFEHTMAIRFGTSKKVLFEKNIVRGRHGVHVNDLLQFWYASGCVNDVAIRDNEFAEIPCAINIHVDRPPQSKMRHKNVTVTGNRFLHCGTALRAQRTDQLCFKDNIFEGVTTKAEIKDCTGDFDGGRTESLM